MDKFEEMMSAMRKMKPDEMAKAAEKYKAMCICPTCPTHTRCAKNAKETFFCITGKSFMCISEEKGCPTCPVTPEFGLKHKFYCTRGAEKALRYEHALWGTKMV